MNTTEQKIEIIKQAIELKTGRKCKVWNDEAFCYFSYEGEGQYQQSRRISNHLLNLLPLSETEVNGVTEKNGWVSVKELPEESKIGQRVLLWDGSNYYLGHYSTLLERFISSHAIPIEPTHWMPLPAPPINK